MDEYYEAKRRLFTEHEPAPAAAINVGDEWGTRCAGSRSRPCAAPPSGSPGRRGRDEAPKSRLQGRFNQENTLAALAVARLVGVPEAAIDQGLADAPSVQDDSSRSTRVSRSR